MLSFAIPLFVGAFHHCCYCRLPGYVPASVILVATVQVTAGQAMHIRYIRLTHGRLECIHILQYWYFIVRKFHIVTSETNRQ